MPELITLDLIRSTEPRAKPFEIRDTRLKGFLLRVQPGGSKTFYVEYARGKRVRIGPADALAPSHARERARQILADVALGGDPHEAQREAKAHSFRTFVDDVYAPWAEANIRTPRGTLTRLRSNFPTLQDKKLADINAWLVEKWRAARLKAGVKPTTVNRDLDDLRSVLAKAVAWGHLETHPLNGVKRSRTDNNARIRYLDDDEEKRLRAVLDAREERIRRERDRGNAWRAADRLKPLVLLSMNTGIRRGEAFAIRWDDVDLVRATLTVRGESAKSGRTRHIPLNAEALQTLTAWRAQSSGNGLIFPGLNGERSTNTPTPWPTVLAEAGVERFRWHDLRHHFASRLVMAGVDLNTVRELLGHASYELTLRYAHLAPERKAAAVAKLAR
jgi:integrase